MLVSIYFFLFVIGYLIGHDPRRRPLLLLVRNPWIRMLRAWGLLVLVGGWTGGTVAPALTGLALILGERLPLLDLGSGRAARPLNLYSLAGVWLALAWPLGLCWLALLQVWRYLARLTPYSYHAQLIFAVLPVAAGYWLQKPDAFLILAYWMGAQLLVGPTIQLLTDRGWLPKRSRRRSYARGVPVIMSIMLLVLGIYYLNYYVYHGFGQNIQVIRRGAPATKAVVLTFDDGPNPAYTPRILEILEQYQAPAAFFMVGEAVEQHPDLARLVVSKGYEIGNHTYSHRNLFRPGGAVIGQEIELANRAIERVTGERPLFFRPPRGAYTQQVLDAVREKKQIMVLFSLSGMDWAELPPQIIAQHVLRRVQPGDILLLHDSGDLITPEGGDRQNTVDALPLIIDGLRRQGYRLLTLSQMMVLSGMEGYIQTE